MDTEVKLIMLKLLAEDIDVINAVKKIAGFKSKASEFAEIQEAELQEQIKQLNKELELSKKNKDLVEVAYSELKIELEKKKKIITDIEKEKANEIREKDKVIEAYKDKYSECEKRKDDAIKKYNDLNLRYKGIDSIYNKYKDLGNQIIKKMERILNRSAEISSSPEIFMSYGVQENNIVALWESIATNFDVYESYGKNQDLVDIFLYFLELYEEIAFKEVSIKWPTLGAMYDERIHTRTASSNAVGTIQKVILPGFTIGKNITKKSLVVVK